MNLKKRVLDDLNLYRSLRREYLNPKMDKHGRFNKTPYDKAVEGLEELRKLLSQI